MKKSLTLIMAFSLCLFSCEKEEENPDIALDDVKFGFANQEEDLIPIPEALQGGSEIPEASITLGWLNLANSLTSVYSQMFTIPSNATRSSNPVVASNGRMAEAEYLVYTWEGDNGYGLAYQVHKVGDQYVLEILVKMSNQDGWKLYLYAEQDKEGKNGLLKVYDYFSVESQLTYVYTWQTVGDTLKLDFGSSSIAFIKVEVNTKTGEGFMKYLMNEEVRYEINWTGDGSGSWTYYGENGNLSGTWEA